MFPSVTTATCHTDLQQGRTRPTPRRARPPLTTGCSRAARPPAPLSLPPPDVVQVTLPVATTLYDIAFDSPEHGCDRAAGGSGRRVVVVVVVAGYLSYRRRSRCGCACCCRSLPARVTVLRDPAFELSVAASRQSHCGDARVTRHPTDRAAISRATGTSWVRRARSLRCETRALQRRRAGDNARARERAVVCQPARAARVAASRAGSRPGSPPRPMRIDRRFFFSSASCSPRVVYYHHALTAPPPTNLSRRAPSVGRVVVLDLPRHER